MEVIIEGLKAINNQLKGGFAVLDMATDMMNKGDS
jgi:hypothetical protein